MTLTVTRLTVRNHTGHPVRVSLASPQTIDIAVAERGQVEMREEA